MRTTHVKNEVDDEEVDDEEVEENHAPRFRVGECLLQDGDEEPLERVLAVVRSGIITRDGGGERGIRCIRVMHFGVGGMRILSIPLLSRNGWEEGGAYREELVFSTWFNRCWICCLYLMFSNYESSMRKKRSYFQFIDSSFVSISLVFDHGFKGLLTSQKWVRRSILIGVFLLLCLELLH